MSIATRAAAFALGLLLPFAVLAAPKAAPKPAPKAAPKALNVAWEAVQGQASQISIGADNAVWVVGTNGASGGFGIWRQAPNGWQNAASAGCATCGGVRIAVRNASEAWLVNASGFIWHYAGGSWKILTEPRASDIAVGANGAAYFIASSGNPAAGGEVFRLENEKPVRVGGWAKRIAVGPRGEPWTVDKRGDVFFRAGSGWRKAPGISASAIAVGPNGQVWAVDGKSVHRFAGAFWDHAPGGGVSIAVDSAGNPWITRADKSIARGAFTAAAAVASAPPAAMGTVEVAWQPVQGAALDIVVDKAGTAWVIDTLNLKYGHGVERWGSRGWEALPGSIGVGCQGCGAVRVAPIDADEAYAVNDQGDIYRYKASAESTNNPYSTPAWIALGFGKPFKAVDVAVAASGAIFAVDDKGVVHRIELSGGRGTGAYSQPFWAASAVPIGGSAVRVSAGTGMPFTVDKAGAVAFFDGRAWNAAPGAAASAVAVSVRGAVWATGPKGTFHWTGQRWDRAEAAGAAIGVGPGGEVWLVRADHTMAKGSQGKTTPPALQAAHKAPAPRRR